VTVSDNRSDTIDARVAELDRMISDRLSAVMQAPEFQRMELPTDAKRNPATSGSSARALQKLGLLRRADVGSVTLGAGSRLGWDAFLCTQPAHDDRARSPRTSTAHVDRGIARYALQVIH
jgi:hypothetical protein